MRSSAGAGLLLRHAAPRFTGNTARIRVSAERGEWDLALRVDPAGKILSFRFNEPPSSSVRDRNSVRLRLPFRGEWFVISGGDDPSRNHHIASGLAAEARAVDFAVCDQSGKFRGGSDDRNENYYAYNQPILAPADGTVLVVIEGVPDNQPGKTNYFAALGNTIILKHAGDEFSVLSHLREKSISVKVGDQVTAGQRLARCGNSGNTFSPHLHFQLMTSGVPFDATGYAPYFEGVRLRRKDEKEAVVSKEYTPQSGDRVRQEVETPEESRRAAGRNQVSVERTEFLLLSKSHCTNLGGRGSCRAECRCRLGRSLALPDSREVVYLRTSHSVFKYSTSCDRSTSLRLAPNSCPALELPGIGVPSELLTLKRGKPGTLVKNPTFTGSNVRTPMLKLVGRFAAGWSNAFNVGTDPLCR